MNMGFPEFREDFEAFKKLLPDPSMVARHPFIDELPDADHALEHTEIMFYRWWALMVNAGDEFRLLIQKQDGEARRYGLSIGVPYILARVDWVIAFLEGLPPVPDWNAPHIDIGQRVDLMNFAKKYPASIQRWLTRARKLRESIQSIAEDYDPDRMSGRSIS
ncbi:MAG: hypothetical protein J0H34_06880 [Rhizobiales bacterium]|nr:hypothetical protein [Hyphomicrobiales bacterium]